MDELQFEEIYRVRLAQVLAYTRRRAVSAESAEEAAAETFLVAWRRRDEIPADPLPWLYGVARRVLANQRRSDGRRAALLDAIAHDRSGPAGGLADELAPFTPVENRLASALLRLDEDDREALMLIAWEELGYREAADALGISEPAFSRRLRRARTRLQSFLEEAPEAMPHGAARHTEARP